MPCGCWGRESHPAVTRRRDLEDGCWLGTISTDACFAVCSCPSRRACSLAYETTRVCSSRGTDVLWRCGCDSRLVSAVSFRGLAAGHVDVCGLCRERSHWQRHALAEPGRRGFGFRQHSASTDV